MQQHSQPTLTLLPRASIDRRVLANCVDACDTAQRVLVASVDALVIDDDPDRLRRCIHLTLRCAEVCASTARLLSSRTGGMNLARLRAQVEICLRACATCEAECHERGIDESSPAAAAAARCAYACVVVLRALDGRC